VNYFFVKSKRSKKIRAFTLIETVLVIAVLSIVISLGIIMRQQNTQQAKIELTALRMQQLIGAANVYYIDNACWPKKGAIVTCNTPSPPDFVANYVAINGTKDAWGNEFNWGAAVSNRLFEVSVNTSDSSIDKPIAKRIAAILPAAVIGGGLCGTITNCVRAQSNAQQLPPLQVSNAILTSVGHAAIDMAPSKPHQVDIHFNKCPDDAPNLVIKLMPNAYKFYRYNSNGVNLTPVFDVSRRVFVLECTENMCYIGAAAEGTNCSVYARVGVLGTPEELNCGTTIPLSSIGFDYAAYCCKYPACDSAL
jgi:prepilin-type N-terminal cleavage/methylation domain-containing protein